MDGFAGPASGKLGPFVGKCSLDFPTETEYIANIAYFGGALSIDLVSTYSAGKNHKIDLDLLRNDIKVFGFQVMSFYFSMPNMPALGNV